MKLVCHKYRMYVFAPASESVVGDDGVDVVFSDYCLYVSMFFFEVGESTWY